LKLLSSLLHGALRVLIAGVASFFGKKGTLLLQQRKKQMQRYGTK